MSAEDEVLEPGEAAGGLFPIVPTAAPPEVAERLDPLLALGGSVGVLLRGDGEEPDLGRRLEAVCARHGVALFVDRPDRVDAVGATGVLLDDAAAVTQTRARFGRTMLIGVACGVSRHAAMVGGEAGADFVAFGSLDRLASERLLDTLSWWNEVFVLPSLALARVEGEAEVEVLRSAGADFVAVPIDLLLTDDDPPTLLGRLRIAVGAA